MKKLLALIMALTFVFTLAACGSNEGTADVSSDDETIIVSSTETVSSEVKDTNNSSSKVQNNTSSKVNTTSQPAAACTHKNIQTTPAVEADCGNDGKTEGKTCKDCGKVLVASQTIPKTGDHVMNPATETKPATCAFCGYTQGSVARPNIPINFPNTSLNLPNGAKITSIWDVQLVWINDEQCNFKYAVQITNGPTAGVVEWNLDVARSEHKIYDMTVSGSSGKSLAANETITVNCETGTIPAAGATGGYTFTLKNK